MNMGKLMIAIGDYTRDESLIQSQEEQKQLIQSLYYHYKGRLQQFLKEAPICDWSVNYEKSYQVYFMKRKKQLYQLKSITKKEMDGTFKSTIYDSILEIVVRELADKVNSRNSFLHLVAVIASKNGYQVTKAFEDSLIETGQAELRYLLGDRETILSTFPFWKAENLRRN